jgi:hypothetical protein
MNISKRWDRNYAVVRSFAKEQGHLNLPSTTSLENTTPAIDSTWLRRQKKLAPDCQKEEVC